MKTKKQNTNLVLHHGISGSEKKVDAGLNLNVIANDASKSIEEVVSMENYYSILPKYSFEEVYSKNHSEELEKILRENIDMKMAVLKTMDSGCLEIVTEKPLCEADQKRLAEVLSIEKLNKKSYHYYLSVEFNSKIDHQGLQHFKNEIFSLLSIFVDNKYLDMFHVEEGFIEFSTPSVVSKDNLEKIKKFFVQYQGPVLKMMGCNLETIFTPMTLEEVEDIRSNSDYYTESFKEDLESDFYVMAGLI